MFVDSGSSVKVIFQEAFGQMDIQQYKLEPIETALFGFTGHTVYPGGTLGSKTRKTVMTSFTSVEAPSSYNIILGRPTMSALRAVASTYHQKIKFGGESSRRGPLRC